MAAHFSFSSFHSRVAIHGHWFLQERFDPSAGKPGSRSTAELRKSVSRTRIYQVSYGVCGFFLFADSQPY